MEEEASKYVKGLGEYTGGASLVRVSSRFNYQLLSEFLNYRYKLIQSKNRYRDTQL